MKRIAALTIALALPLAGCSTMNQQTRDCTSSGKEAVHNGDSNQYHTYTITTGGYRIGIANEFPNIIEATEKQ